MNVMFNDFVIQYDFICIFNVLYVCFAMQHITSSDGMKIYHPLTSEDNYTLQNKTLRILWLS